MIYYAWIAVTLTFKKDHKNFLIDKENYLTKHYLRIANKSILSTMVSSEKPQSD